jgi:hypothetical protein
MAHLKDKPDHDLLLDALSDTVHRGYSQLKELYELCDYDLDKLMELERKLKSNFLSYCPGDKEEVEKCLAMPERHFPDWFVWDEWNVTVDTKNRWTLVFTNAKGKTHLVAVPPTEGNRLDVLENTQGREWKYTCDFKGESFKGLPVMVVNGQITRFKTT